LANKFFFTQKKVSLQSYQSINNSGCKLFLFEKKLNIHYKMKKNLSWYLRRHPILYKIRHWLVAKNVSHNRINSYCYNDINKKRSIPALFFEINNKIFAAGKPECSDFDQALQIAVWLKKNIKGGPGLGKSSPVALQTMIDGKGGVCSDFSQIYSNFCVINDIKVKEWGIKNLSNDPRFSGGHSYNEVYCSTMKKWVLVDVSKGILLFQKNTNIPLSSLEYIQLKKENKEIVISTIIPNDVIDLPRIQNIYLVFEVLPFVVTNYNNKIVDFFLDKLSFFPESIVHGMIIMLGQGYNFEFPKAN
jgi:hypothetical protein